MLKITGEGRKAALDMRLDRSRSEQPEVETKLTAPSPGSSRSGRRVRSERSTQLVFSDLSTPDPERFNVYDDVRSKLVQAGVPAAEIAFIHDAETDVAKKLLFDAVIAGRVRILLGSTEKMGAGTNVQRRLIALHHLDAPWRPRDIEQREGRILRQGNANKEVQIFRYVTEGSFDAYMWQTLETKARFIHQVMRGETSVRSAEDLESGALTYAEIKAIASGNPAVVEKIKIDTEVRKLDQLRAVHRISSAIFAGRFATCRDRSRSKRLWRDRSRHRNQKCKRYRRVRHAGWAPGFLRQRRAGGSGQRAMPCHSHVA